MSRAKNPQVICHKAIPHDPQPWHRVLDACVAQSFATHHVVSRTQFSNCRWLTIVKHKNGAALTPALYKRVSAFIDGFMACENSYNET